MSLGARKALVVGVSGAACLVLLDVAAGRLIARDDARNATRGDNVMTMNKLSPEEERVIVGKGTERPFSGAYWNLHEDGSYRCRRCGAPLFPSSAKFDSGTGWPSFDDAFPAAVLEVRDADGQRAEIVCAKCGAHLGHVFRGEGFTDKQTRHCVNSLSLAFVPAAGDVAAGGESGTSGAAVAAAGAAATAGTCANADDPAPAKATADAYFAGGCFWGVEYWMEKAPGVIRAESGYMGGAVDYPTYGQVGSGRTGHAETVHVVYDPSRTTYEALAKLFFDIHDPTQVDQQGPDRGTQYRSAVFPTDAEQLATVQGLIERLKARGFRVATRVEPAGPFWRAEEYHQHWYQRKGSEPYCHAREDRFGD